MSCLLFCDIPFCGPCFVFWVSGSTCSNQELSGCSFNGFFQHCLSISFLSDPTWGCKTHKVWFAYGVRVSPRLHVLETQSPVWQQKEVVEPLRSRRSQDSSVVNGPSLRNGPNLAGVAPSRYLARLFLQPESPYTPDPSECRNFPFCF